MRSIILLTILAAVFVVASQNMKFLLGVTVAGILTVVLLVSVVLEIEPTNKPKKQESSSEVEEGELPDRIEIPEEAEPIIVDAESSGGRNR
ncbi:TPA: hypothetical protein EYN09_14620 [Candidatus Poribacteria bacterium]|mgnify:CR=1 FL=1|nr:hypothetical protein [Candidatus Poribacteria bacterium]HIC02265.1 hypothetical protein [Candidatus Poribacteria bacterium]HIM10389.1 hypothetical protein [Candidatus Poribacteria bacterium]HIO08142.1 hypothetical protein [Candidatus Poribacteria bacterium]HIO78977.1 hypothetical protein [Candidatus Poribacteria bacterium]